MGGERTGEGEKEVERKGVEGQRGERRGEGRRRKKRGEEKRGQRGEGRTQEEWGGEEKGEGDGRGGWETDWPPWPPCTAKFITTLVRLEAISKARRLDCRSSFQ